MPKRPGRKSAAQTPAPKSDRIKGSAKNPKGSAASSKAGEKIRLSREIINTLTEKVKKFNEENPRKKVTLGTLKAVFRRGSGAYSSSHRPTITGGKPNSRTAWSYARVNTFLAKKAGKPTKAAYVQDDDLLEDGGHVAPLLAANGKPSNLTPEQYKLVRTSEFKAWFGDWENDSENASKVVDENGEPKVMYHGSRGIFNVFKNENDNKLEWTQGGLGFYFTSYSVSASAYGNRIINAFINARNVKKSDESEHAFVTHTELEKLHIQGYDAIYFDGQFTKTNGRRGWKEDELVVFKSNQIKLADGSNTTFDSSNPDIRFKEGGKVHYNEDGQPYYIRKGALNISFLDDQEWTLATSQSFKKWFGDWQSDKPISSLSRDLSKVRQFMYYGSYLGEPRIVYHASTDWAGKPYKEFFTFEHTGYARDPGFFGKGFYFGISEESVKQYGQHVRKFFLNLRNPYTHGFLASDEGNPIEFAEELGLDHLLYSPEKYKEETPYPTKEFAEAVKEKLISLGYDGIHINSKDGEQYVAFYPEQIKLADGRNTTFDSSNPDVRYNDGGLTAVRLHDTFDTAKDIDDIVRIAQEKKIDAKDLTYDEFKEKIIEQLPESDLDFIELRLAYNELKKAEYAKGGKTKEKTMKAKGNCYEAAGDVVIMYKSPFSALRFSLGMDDLKFQGEPYLVHAEVAGQGALEGIRYGHAWIEDDVFVYDFSNNRQIVLPKAYYYQVGQVSTEDPKKYRKYTFEEAKRKMLDEGTYGSWDIETDYRDGGRVYNDQELLEKWKAGEKIGFSATAHLKSKGLIPRADGSKKVSMAEGAEVVDAANMIKCSNCGWSWSIHDSDPFDMYVCHQCGTDNTPKLLETQDVAKMNGYVLLRFLEFAKEDAKTDMELHKLVENIMALSATKTLTMDDYDKAMEGIAPVEMAEGGQVFDSDLYGMRKTMLNSMYGQYLKFADNLDPSQLQGKTKEEWAKKETLDWARRMGKVKKVEEEQVLVDVRTGQVIGKRKDYMIRPEFKKGGVVLLEDIEDYNQDKVKFGGYEVGTTAYLAKKDERGNWISAGKIVGYKEKGRFGDLYIVTDKGHEIHNTQLLEVKGLEKYGFKMEDGGETRAQIEIDIDNLDPLERLMFEDMSKKMSKEDALRVIVNTFEADGQLSEELEKYAAKMKLEEIYASQIQTELDTIAHYYDKPFTLWVSGLDNSGGWEYFNLSQAIEGANNLGILENNNNYEIRDTASGRLVLTKAQILDVISGKASAEEFAFGGDVEDQVMDEVESEAYIADEKEEAKAILYSRKMSKLQKILFISDRIDYAREHLKRAEDGLEENVWEEIFDIWKDAFARVENNYCERVRPEYKEGGVTSDCGCGKYYAKGGLAYGNSHAKGGMPMTVKSTGQNIEIEGGEGVVNKKSMQISKKVTLNGEQMTPCEAVSEINEMGGGVKFKCADVKEIIEDDGNF